MKSTKKLSRGEMIMIVTQILDPKRTNESCPPSVVDSWLSQLENSTGDLEIQDLIFWAERSMIAEEIVDTAIRRGIGKKPESEA
jgi:hypothetical protein